MIHKATSTKNTCVWWRARFKGGVKMRPMRQRHDTFCRVHCDTLAIRQNELFCRVVSCHFDTPASGKKHFSVGMSCRAILTPQRTTKINYRGNVVPDAFWQVSCPANDMLFAGRQNALFVVRYLSQWHDTARYFNTQGCLACKKMEIFS